VDFISIDIETDSEDWQKANLKVVGYAHSNGQAEALIYPKDTEKIKTILASPLPKVGHNIKFDIQVLKRHGFTILGEWEDTFILSQLHQKFGFINSETGKPYTEGNGLKPICSYLFKENLVTYSDLLCKYNQGKGKKAKKKSEFDHNLIPMEVLCKYNIKDCLITSKLFKWLLENIDESNLKVYQEIEKPLLRVVVDMEIKGIGVDKKQANKLLQHGVEQSERMKRMIFDYAGEEFNVNPSLDSKRVLYEKFKCPILSETKAGASETEETLKELDKGGYKIAGMLLEYRKWAKIISTYYKPYTNVDRVHGKFSQTGTETGRFSCSSPNMQNIPDEARSIFVPTQVQYE
jgi:DNA polymerase I